MLDDTQVTTARRGASPQPVVLIISHRHGYDATAHPGEQDARTALAGFARQWWDEIADYDGRATPGVTFPAPDEDEETIRIYFDHQADEDYLIIPLTCDIPAAAPPASTADSCTLDGLLRACGAARHGILQALEGHGDLTAAAAQLAGRSLDLIELTSSIKTAAGDVIGCWERGDLAAAVNQLRRLCFGEDTREQEQRP